MSKTKFYALKLCLVLIVMIVAILPDIVANHLFQPVFGAQLQNRRLQLNDNIVSDNAEYLLSFTTLSSGSLGSISIQFCSNDALVQDICIPPAGFDDSAAVLANQRGDTGFTISPLSTANEIILTRPSIPTSALNDTYDFTGMVNPSSSSSYYTRIQTYPTSNATGPSTDYGGLAFAILNNNTSISAEVPPYLIFCTGVTISGLNCANAVGDFIDVGELSNTHASTGSSQMLVASNANHGYAITVLGTTMTSGNNIINALANNDVSRPGVGQFGFNLRANVTPPDGSDPSGPGTGQPSANYDIPNNYRFDSGDTIASTSGPDNLREYTASYVINVPAQQAPGIYVSTVTYIALATF